MSFNAKYDEFIQSVRTTFYFKIINAIKMCIIKGTRSFKTIHQYHSTIWTVMSSRTMTD